MTEATPLVVSRPPQMAPACFCMSRSPIISVFVVPSVTCEMRIDEPPSLTCSLTA
jgi:hypothetical protein